MDDDLRPVPKHELRFDIEHALRKARSLWPRKHVHGDHNALGPVRTQSSNIWRSAESGVSENLRCPATELRSPGATVAGRGSHPLRDGAFPRRAE